MFKLLSLPGLVPFQVLGGEKRLFAFLALVRSFLGVFLYVSIIIPSAEKH